MLPPTIPPHEQYLYEEKEEFGDHENKLVSISIHKNCHIGMHKHNFYELNVILSGSGVHYIEGMAVPAAPGDVFMLPIGVEHGYLCEQNFHVAHVLMKEAFIKKYYTELSAVPGFDTFFNIEPYLRRVYDTHLFLHLNAKQLEAFCREIEHQMLLPPTRYEAYQNLFVLHLLGKLSYEMHNQRKNMPETENRDILKVLEYIQKHYEEKISIETLTKIANMSRPTLHRHFKAITDLSPMQYIMKLRLIAVRDQLSKHDKTENKTQLAQKYGFFDTSHLNKHLHKKDNSAHGK